MGLIPGLIPKQNFEVIRDALGALLMLEMSAQYALDNSYPNIQAVDVERFIPYSGDTELPRINVNVDKIEWNQQSSRIAYGDVTYNIDIYATGNSSEVAEGDKEAMYLTSKIAGLVRAIITNPVYANLGVTPGAISSRCIDKLMILSKAQVADALSNVLGRVQLMVRCAEGVELSLATNLVTEMTTKVKLNNSTYGYYYDIIL